MFDMIEFLSNSLLLSCIYLSFPRSR